MVTPGSCTDIVVKWGYTGRAEARVRPDLLEIADLKRNDDSNAAVEGKSLQTFDFILYLNPTLFFEGLLCCLCSNPFPETIHKEEYPTLIHNRYSLASSKQGTRSGDRSYIRGVRLGFVEWYLIRH